MARRLRPSTTYIPIKEIIGFARQGYNDSTIIRKLKEQGYTPRQINDAFSQLKIKAAAGNLEEERMEPSMMTTGDTGESADAADGEMMAPVPGREEAGAAAAQGYGTPSEESELSEEGFAYPQAVQYPTYESRPSTEVIEEMAEEIINEKWRDFKIKAGDFAKLRNFFEEKLKSLALRMKRLENSMDKMQSSVMTHIRDYGSDIRTLRAEVHALETAFSKILEPLVTNIRKLEEGVAEKELTRLRKKDKQEDKLESLLGGKRKRRKKRRK
jgi:hypothetical protein